MARFTLDRAFYIPKDSTEERDPESSAVSYLYTNRKGQPAAACFSGKRAKPDSHYYYATEASRAAAVERHRDSTRKTEQYKAERHAGNVERRRKASALDFAGQDWLSAADVAALARRVLAEAFPGQKFSVRTRNSCLDIEWTDGPSVADVERLANLFEGSYFDGMIDYKGSIDHTLDGRRVRFGLDFVQTRRSLSPEALALGLAAYEAAADYRAGAVQIGEPDRWGNIPVIATPEHPATVKGCYHDTEIEAAPGASRSFCEPRRALESWYDHAHRVEPQPSPTRQRVSVLGSDGYGNTALPATDGGEGGRGYPKPKEKAPDPAAVEAAEQLAAELAASNLFAEFLATWQPEGRPN